jgi:hypothetical protein
LLDHAADHLVHPRTPDRNSVQFEHLDVDGRPGLLGRTRLLVTDVSSLRVDLAVLSREHLRHELAQRDVKWRRWVSEMAGRALVWGVCSEILLDTPLVRFGKLR